MTELVSLPSVARRHSTESNIANRDIETIGTSAGGFEALAVGAEQDGYLHDHHPRTAYG
jgi:hypothetical protein